MAPPPAAPAAFQSCAAPDLETCDGFLVVSLVRRDFGILVLDRTRRIQRQSGEQRHTNATGFAPNHAHYGNFSAAKPLRHDNLASIKTSAAVRRRSDCHGHPPAGWRSWRDAHPR